MHTKTPQPVSRQLMYVVLGTGLVLMVPLLAKLFTNEMQWDLFDFLVAGMLLMGAGSTFVLTARLVKSRQARISVGAVIGLALLLVWAERAVGIVGSPFAGS